LARSSFVANRQLSDDERKRLFEPLISEVRTRLKELSKGDDDLMWALRRKLTKELGYDERSKPMYRKILKLKKMAAQKGFCAVCGKEPPEKNSVLDRLEAMGGYTEQNTRLICAVCNVQIQEERGYK
jgi:RNA polymerase-binding transcription factor DksA